MCKDFAKQKNVTPVNTTATSNCLSSMVQTVLYRRCTETTVPCSPYCTCIQYGSDASTERKKITKFIMVQSQTTRHQSTRTTRQQWRSNSPRLRGSETGVERDAERERKTEEKEVWGRKWSMWSSQNKQMWPSDGCEQGNVESSYQHGTNGTV
jgi:hypothetical protein